MLIESLVRLGRPFLSVSQPPASVLRLVSDIADDQAGRFYQQVLVVEVDPGLAGSEQWIVVHPSAEWGNIIEEKSPRGKTVKRFVPDIKRTCAAPIVLPSGGRPTARQGYYPVPAYYVYVGSKDDSEGSLRAMYHNPSQVLSFLRTRVPFTIRSSKDLPLDLIGAKLSEMLPDPSNKIPCLILIVDYSSGVFTHGITKDMPEDAALVDIGPSRIYENEHIFADLNVVLERFWEAKFSEASEKGELTSGICSICRKSGRVVSTYAKGWPFFTTTYSFPLPSDLRENELVKSIGLCKDCYSALLFGAAVFRKLERTIDRSVVKEVFSPVSVASGDQSQTRRETDTVFGSFFVLPVLDEFLKQNDDKEVFVKAISAGFNGTSSIGEQLQDVLGFEAVLPDQVATDVYRFTALYYKGNWNRGDVNVIAQVQDVVPSVAKSVNRICKQVSRESVAVARSVAASYGSGLSDAETSYISGTFSSLPRLLAKAYGGTYVWTVLNKVLHRMPLDEDSFVRNVAVRMQKLSHAGAQGKNNRMIGDEVVFYLAFEYFLQKYYEEVCVDPERRRVFMADWQEWLARLQDNKSQANWEPESVEELGFAIGVLTRAFSRQYYQKSGEKDFIKHRVMTFGSTLHPEDIWSKGVSRFSEYARKLAMRIPADLREMAAKSSLCYLEMRDKIRMNSDGFIAAFWAGYELCPQDAFKAPSETPETA